MYKSAKEIKEILGIDISQKNRTIIFVALRAFYAEIKVKEMEGIPNSFDTIANEIGCKRVNIYNYILKTENFKKDKLIKILYKAFKTKDKALINKYKDEVKSHKALIQSAFYIKKALFKNKHTPIVIEKKEVVSKMSNLKLAEYLRTNKVLKHKLWDTPIRNISEKQWKQIRTINTEMFDNFANN